MTENRETVEDAEQKRGQLRRLSHPKGDQLTEILTSLYVFVGVVLLAVASRLDLLTSVDAMVVNRLLLSAIVVCAFMAALATYVTRCRTHETALSFTVDQNRLTPTDWLAAIHAIAFGVFGLLALSLPPTSAHPHYALMLVVMVAALGLNTYFMPYWRAAAFQASDPIGVEALKLQHTEWSGMFANACLGFLVAMGGAVYALFAAFGPDAGAVGGLRPSPLGLFLDGLLLGYCVLGPTIVWLLRPMYVTMVRIRIRLDQRERYDLGGMTALKTRRERPAA